MFDVGNIVFQYFQATPPRVRFISKLILVSALAHVFFILLCLLFSKESRRLMIDMSRAALIIEGVDFVVIPSHKRVVGAVDRVVHKGNTTRGTTASLSKSSPPAAANAVKSQAQAPIQASKKKEEVKKKEEKKVAPLSKSSLSKSSDASKKEVPVPVLAPAKAISEKEVAASKPKQIKAASCVATPVSMPLSESKKVEKAPAPEAKSKEAFPVEQKQKSKAAKPLEKTASVPAVQPEPEKKAEETKKIEPDVQPDPKYHELGKKSTDLLSAQSNKLEAEQALASLPLTDETIFIGREDLYEVTLYKEIAHALKQEWKAPAGLVPTASCIVVAKIGPDGKATQVTLERSSGILVYDVAATAAVERSQFGRGIAGREISINFN